VVDRNLRDTSSSAGTSDPWPDNGQIFQIDRSRMVLLLRNLRRGIDEGAKEMEMVAIESVFAKAVSQALTRTARKLHRVSEGLNELLRLVERAHLPKAPLRPTPKAKAGNRRQRN
jgi:hypothetical protein